MVGESGSGKSTLLKAIYGLLHLNDGSIHWKGKQLLGPNFNIIPGESFIKYLPQDFALMPFITAAENVSDHLSDFYPEEKEERTRELLDITGMADYADVKAQFLSGGQKQRIALAKALAEVPELLLLDEPFSQIDNFKKNILRRDLFSFLRKKNISCIIATHDITDALSFADRSLVMYRGEIVENGSPSEIFNSPGSFYTASMFGEVNELPATEFLSDQNGQRLLLYSHELNVSSENNGIKVRVKKSYFKGSNYLIEGVYKGGPIFFENPALLEVNSYVYLDCDRSLLLSRPALIQKDLFSAFPA